MNRSIKSRLIGVHSGAVFFSGMNTFLKCATLFKKLKLLLISIGVTFFDHNAGLTEYNASFFVPFVLELLNFFRGLLNCGIVLAL